MAVLVQVESGRGCGYRKPGKDGYGLYLMAEGPFAPCGRLPFALRVCPTCGGGVKPSRGWTWITPSELLKSAEYGDCDSPACYACPMDHLSHPSLQGEHGLLWVGEKFYSSAQNYMAEGNRMGISRKISAIPQGFKMGHTWVFLAHRKAIPYTTEDGDLEWLPGIFMAFKPERLDVVIDDENDVPDYARHLQEQYGEENCHIVKVVRDTDTQGELL